MRQKKLSDFFFKELKGYICFINNNETLRRKSSVAHMYNPSAV